MKFALMSAMALTARAGGYAKPNVHMGVVSFNATEVYHPPKVRNRHDVRMEEDKRLYAIYEQEREHDQNTLHDKFD